ncbi:MAG: PQQ-dependent sugar dehydrogenase [Acidimicrobiales bacterium]|nr:PQQ-dependent sugar dehydrogenase [Acidimicrobiales bacterium]MXZ15332.1 PQQ-dependent sugar dehydrogenase [Acidimicrobiales bacterium]MYB81760.1 PQQ-dependent sugar dehydrogenase [Acidimicrobiales bacterium]MYI13218.1 PQQ-dependent sugar dehydrogenase [Acidimicrobiales bacterium]MYJ48298.1 PQQ-dependent sugar dehydrogenase [Acidimicrobiales bacterium]
MRLVRATAALMTAVFLAAACGTTSGDQDTPAVGGQSGETDAGPNAVVTAPPALRSADADHPAGPAGDDLPDTSSPASVSDTVQAAPEAPAPPPSAPLAGDAVPSLAETRFELVPVAEIAAPIALAARPGTSQRYVASRLGQVWLLDPSDGSGEPQQVADISAEVSEGCENGLLGLAFSPDGDHLYLSYTDTARNSRIAVVPMSGDAPQTDRTRVLLALDQPACNHNGGEVQLGPDGNLWIGFGDGGGADDVFGQGQDRSTLLGTLVRIDPDPPSGRGYGIPAGNPFASGNAPEVWAYGARNPWRFSFDRLTGDLWIADVGQNRIEEIHVLPAADGWSPGANLGWPLFEGNERFSGEATPADLVFPVYTYAHDDGCSVTGGYVYRGSAIAALGGAYVFGDYCAGDLWGLVRGAGGAAERIDLGVSVPRNTLVSFGQDADGELYALSAAGTVFRLEAAAP